MQHPFFSKHKSLHEHEGEHPNKQPTFPPPQTDHARTTTSTHLSPDGLHFSDNFHRPTSRVLVRDGLTGVSTDVHYGVEQTRSVSSNTESIALSGNCHRGYVSEDGGLHTELLVHSTNSSPSREPAFLSASSLELSHEPFQPAWKPNDQLSAFLPSPSYGSGVCYMVSVTPLH